MAKGRGKGKSVSSGLRKKHGPSRKLFKELKPMIYSISQSGVLSKYDCFESWALACQARGVKNPSYDDFKRFCLLKTRKLTDEYFASLKQN